MADLFYFSSPRHLTSIPKQRIRSGNRSRSGQKRQPLSMDFLPQRACMARFDEPTFCPSDLSALLSQYHPLPSGLDGDGSPATPDLVDDFEDEDESGGVSLPEDDLDEEMTDAFAETRIAGSPLQSTSRSAGTVASVHIIRSTVSRWTLPAHGSSVPQRIRQPPSQVSAQRSVLGSSHPRPQTRDMWEQEDGRRLRFALAGIDTSEAPRFAVPNDTGTPSDQETSDNLSWHTERQRAASTNALSNAAVPSQSSDSRDALPPTVSTGNPEAQPTSDSQPEPYLTHVDSLTDEDWLAVDDPRRNYDLTTFMDQWRLRSMANKRLPAFEPGVQPSIRLWHAPDEVTPDTMRRNRTDAQGIRWHLIGPTWRDALSARTLLHPSRRVAYTSQVYAAGSINSSPPTDEVRYRFRRFVPRHRAHFSHYQLRNLLAASSRADVCYASGSKVHRTSLCCPTAESKTIMDLTKPENSAAGFRITCLAATQDSADNLLLAGGFYGEYALLNLNSSSTEAPTEGFVTHAYNGLVTHIHTCTARRSNSPQAAFCSNDSKVRLMDLGTLRFTDTFTYPDAINCSSTSPDSRLRISVGDTMETHITDAERGHTLVTLRGHTDHGFACAWAPNGTHVATGAQDGKTLVWDARNWTSPLCTLESTMSCPRSLHFTHDSALVVAENDDVVSFYDHTTFVKRQDLRFFGSIAGVALLDGGSELVVANADKTVGGLLAFQRTTQGLNKGTFGKPVQREQASPRLRRHVVDYDDPISNVIV